MKHFAPCLAAIAAGLLLSTCIETKDCKLPDGSKAGFIQSDAPGHQVQPAGTTGYIGVTGFSGCPK